MISFPPGMDFDTLLAELFTAAMPLFNIGLITFAAAMVISVIYYCRLR